MFPISEKVNDFYEKLQPQFCVNELSFSVISNNFF